MLKFLARNLEAADIHQAQMVIRTAGDQTEALLDQLFREDFGVFDDLLRVSFELRFQRFTEADRLSGNNVLQRPALGAGEYGGVDLLVNSLVVAQDQSAAGATEGLVGGRGNDVGIGDGEAPAMITLGLQALAISSRAS